jgi:hypothetical protein
MRNICVIVLVVVCGLTVSTQARAETVKEFLAKCAKSNSDCANDVVTMGAYTAMNPNISKSICSPDNLEMATASVVQWLKAHPQVHPESSDDAIVDALKDTTFGWKSKTGLPITSATRTS